MNYLLGIRLAALSAFLFIAYFLSISFAVLIALFLLSLLTIFKAPTTTLWLVQVVAGEYSIVFIGVTIVALLVDFFLGFYSSISIVLGLVAIGLFSSPIFRAYFIAQQLPNDLKQVFGKCETKAVPFTFNKLLKTVPKVPFRTFTYITYDDNVSLKLDYYNSTTTGKRPCVVVIHGGSWISGDSKQLPEMNSYLAKIGYNVAALNYRLAPKWEYPSPIEDTTAALKYLRDHADELNIDINNFVLLGRSAGGQIATLSAYKLENFGIKGVVDFYGPVDMIWGYLTPTNPLVLDGKKTIARFLGGDLNAIPQTYKDSSPIEFVDEKTVPTLMIHGGIDALVFDEHAHRLAKKLNHSKIPNYFLQIPWGTHGLDYHLNSPSGQLSTYAVEYFLHAIIKQ